MNLSEYIVLFVCVAIMGFGVPGLGDASLIGAGTLAGEGRLNVWAVLATATAAMNPRTGDTPGGRRGHFPVVMISTV